MIYSINDLHIVRISKQINLLKRPSGQRRKYKNAPDYLDIVSAFDIETTTIEIEDSAGNKHPHSFMYIWQFQLGKEITVVGRTWEEFKALLDKIERIADYVGIRYNCKRTPILVVYVHNLAFEFQFLLGIFEFKNDDCFFKKERKPLYAKIRNIEFRDSYALSNMNLAKFAESVGASVRKQSGQMFNYNKIRYPWTALTESEMVYCIDDVITLEECVRLSLERDHDTLYTIPLTSTGYVRRDCKNALQPIRKQINFMLPKVDEYRLLRKAFRGGNTHANRFYVGRILSDVHSYDIRSSYPTQQLTHSFPMKPFQFIEPDMERIKRFIKNGYAVVGLFQFKEIKLRDNMEPMPYISYGCCEALKPVLDNGRILSAEFVEIALTELDLEIVLDQYTASNINCIQAMIAKKEMLPKPYRNVILKYYELKTNLKGVDGREYELMKSKNKLNGIYGMCAQDPIHQTITLLDNGKYSVSDYESEISKHNLQKANFPYQWGVYTTAYARYQLHIAMKAVKKDNGLSRLIYCDTDSIKTIGETDLMNINAKLQDNAYKFGAVATDQKGKNKYIGIWEEDGTYEKFITQGSKRYAYENNEKIHVTVSGVSHAKHEYYNPDGSLEKVVEWASEELRTLENFKPGMIWETKAGGTGIVYNDEDDFYYEPVEGRKIHITRNCSIVDDKYEMKRTDDYNYLLAMCETYLAMKKQFE